MSYCSWHGAPAAIARRWSMRRHAPVATSPSKLTQIRLSLRRGARGDERIVVEHRREPFLRFGDRPALARGIVLDLVALDFADAEIVAVGMAEVEPADRRARPHG